MFSLLTDCIRERWGKEFLVLVGTELFRSLSIRSLNLRSLRSFSVRSFSLRSIRSLSHRSLRSLISVRIRIGNHPKAEIPTISQGHAAVPSPFLHVLLSCTAFRKLDIFPSTGEGGGACSVGFFRKRLSQSLDVQCTEKVSLSLHLKTEANPVSGMLCFFLVI